MFDHLIHRDRVPAVWAKIPWGDPEFSRRMLREHLSQEHDAASRRQTIIDQQVAWLHRVVLREQPASILDLGCGPGFYADRLSRLGHTVTGIDISPASIAYARQRAAGTFIHGDLLQCDFGAGYDLALLIYGELNAFAPEDAAALVGRAYDALKPGGQLVLEVHTHDFVAQVAKQAPTWYTATSGLFSDEPYLCLSESFGDGDRVGSHYYVIDAATGALAHYVTMLQAYTDAAYHDLLRRFARVEFYPSLAGAEIEGQGHLFAIVAVK